MAYHNELGTLGEELATNHLIRKGYTILARNYTFQKAEIDIIAQYDTLLIIVEVKTPEGMVEVPVSASEAQSIAKSKKAYEKFADERIVKWRKKFEDGNLSEDDLYITYKHNGSGAKLGGANL